MKIGGWALDKILSGVSFHFLKRQTHFLPSWLFLDLTYALQVKLNTYQDFSSELPLSVLVYPASLAQDYGIPLSKVGNSKART